MPSELRPVPWAPGYFATEDGRIFSSKRYGPGRPGARQLKPRAHRGYLLVNIVVATRHVTKHVHHLVADAFLPPRKPGEQIRHLDGNRTNNAASNLAWGTAAENAADRDRHGTTARGERNGFSRLTEADVRRLRSVARSGGNVAAEARVLGVSAGAAQAIAKGRGWHHIKEA